PATMRRRRLPCCAHPRRLRSPEPALPSGFVRHDGNDTRRGGPPPAPQSPASVAASRPGGSAWRLRCGRIGARAVRARRSTPRPRRGPSCPSRPARLPPPAGQFLPSLIVLSLLTPPAPDHSTPISAPPQAPSLAVPRLPVPV